MTVPIVVVSLALLLQASKGSIEGTVVNSATNKPIGGAQVQATKMPGAPVAGAGPAMGVLGGVIAANAAGVIVRPPEGPGQMPAQLPVATTDANGHFVF